MITIDVFNNTIQPQINKYTLQFQNSNDSRIRKDALRGNMYLTWKTQDNINIDFYGHSTTEDTKIRNAPLSTSNILSKS